MGEKKIFKVFDTKEESSIALRVWLACTCVDFCSLSHLHIAAGIVLRRASDVVDLCGESGLSAKWALEGDVSAVASRVTLNQRHYAVYAERMATSEHTPLCVCVCV